jgi:hypothetical protein
MQLVKLVYDNVDKSRYKSKLIKLVEVTLPFIRWYKLVQVSTNLH